MTLKLVIKEVCSSAHIKITLMQIGKLPYMFVFIQKQFPEVSLSYSLELSSYLPMKFVNFLKSRLTCNIFYCF